MSPGGSDLLRRPCRKVGQISVGVDNWQTYNQVLDAIVAAHHLELTAAERKHALQKVREALHALKRIGAVICERPGARLGENAFEQRWQLSSMFD